MIAFNVTTLNCMHTWCVIWRAESLLLLNKINIMSCQESQTRTRSMMIVESKIICKWSNMDGHFSSQNNFTIFWTWPFKRTVYIVHVHFEKTDYVVSSLYWHLGIHTKLPWNLECWNKKEWFFWVNRLMSIKKFIKLTRNNEFCFA